MDRFEEMVEQGVDVGTEGGEHGNAHLTASSEGDDAIMQMLSESGSNVPVCLDDFNFLAVLGKGKRGKVMLAETKASKQLYAIKVLNKQLVIADDEAENTRSEKRIFLIANKEKHPLLLNLYACFQTETQICFVVEYISGGNLMFHLQRGEFDTRRAQYVGGSRGLSVRFALVYTNKNFL